MRSPHDAPALPGENSSQLRTYELTPIGDLKPADRNARKHTKRQLAALERSVEAFGIVSPIVRDSENRIVAGHGRVEAARKLGYKAIPTLLLDHLTPEQLRLYALADNAIAEQAGWDEGALALELHELRLEMPDLDLTLSGFNHPQIELAIAGLEQSDWTDLDNCPDELPTEQVTRLGDVWDWPGGHSLVCGDCTLPETVALALRGETVRVIASDPPYNRQASEYSGHGRHHHENFQMAAGEMSRDEFRQFLASSFEAVKPHLANGALVYAFMDGRGIGDLIVAGQTAGLTLRTTLVWDKGAAGLGMMYRSAHELIGLFKHGEAPHIDNVSLTRKQGRDRQTVWRYPGLNTFSKGRDRALSWHATPKPIEMLCDLMIDASNRGDIVYDGFGGSGSTAIAAEKTGRRARLVEINERYCDIVIERFRLAFGQLPTERNTGLTFEQVTELRSATRTEEPCHAE